MAWEAPLHYADAWLSSLPEGACTDVVQTKSRLPWPLMRKGVMDKT